MASLAAAAGTPRSRFLWPGIFVLAGVAILVALGTWQLQRLTYKEALLQRIADRIHAPPVPAPPEAEWPSLWPQDYEYRRVTVSGRFEYDKQALVFRPEGIGHAAGQGPGYLVLTPLRLASGAVIIIDRGFVPLANGERVTQGDQDRGEVTLVGLMRGPEPRGLFTPADNPDKNQWFTRDPAAIAAHFGLERTAPFTIDAEAKPAPGAGPIGGQTVVDIPNNHLGYAITWYGLAAVLLAGFVSYVLSRRSSPAI